MGGFQRKGIKRRPLKSRKRPLKGSRKRVKRETISTLMKEADRLFSLKIRAKDAFIEVSPNELTSNKAEKNHEQLNRCYTCGSIFTIKKLHCGHYLSRYYKAARWDEDNCRPQCYMCNMWKKGDLVVYRQNLIKEIGLERVEAVEAKRHQSTKLTKEYLKDLIAQLSA